LSKPEPPLNPHGTPYFLSSRHPDHRERLQCLSARSGIPLWDGETLGYCLELAEEGFFELFALENPTLRVRADFSSGEFRHRLKTSGKQQPLAKAVGIAKGHSRVLDATGGLGGDAMVLASLGCEVTICERHPLVALLLENGLEQARATLPCAAQVRLQPGDAMAYLASLAEPPPVIYLDPMYAVKDKSALSRKAMQIFESLVGADADQAELFQLARSKATQRVVVKRPRHAPPLAPPTHSFAGSTTRYDMYLAGQNHTTA
jgi:16S rRNA (guanine1516-N2)-methyltransferase